MNEVLVVAKRNTSVLSETQAELLGARTISDVAETVTAAQVKSTGSLKTVSVHNLGANYTTLSIEGVPMSDVQTGQINFSEYSFSDNVELNVLNSSNSPQTASSIISSSEFTSSFSKDSTSRTKLGIESSFYSFRMFSSVSRRYLFSSIDYEFNSGNFPYSYQNGREEISGNRSNNKYHNFNAFCEYSKNKWTILSSLNFNASQLPGPIIFYTGSGNETMNKSNVFVASKFLTYKQDFSFQYLNKIQVLTLGYSDENQIYQSGQYEEKHNQLDFLNSASFKYSKGNFISLISTDLSLSYLNSSFEESPKPFRINSTSAIKAKYYLKSLTFETSTGFSNVYDVLHNVDNINRSTFSYLVKASYCPFSHFTLSSAFKRNFRMPTFNDLYYSRTGNRNVKVEKVNQCLLQAKYVDSFLTVSSSVYYNDIENKIVVIPQAYIWKTLNAGNCKTLGVDVSASLNLKHFEPTLSYSYAKAVMFDKQTPYSPDHSLHIALMWKQDRLKAMVSSRFMSEQFSSFVRDNYSRINPLFDLSFSIAYSFSRFKMLLRISNVTNNTNEYVKYYPAETRNIHLCIIFNL